MKERLAKYCEYYKGENECPFPIVSPKDDDGSRGRWLREKEIVDWIIKALNSVSASLNSEPIRKIEDARSRRVSLIDLLYYVSFTLPLTLSIRKERPYLSYEDNEDFYFADDTEWEESRKSEYWNNRYMSLAEKIFQ